MLIELSKFSDKLRQYRLILEKLTAEQNDYQRRREKLSKLSQRRRSSRKPDVVECYMCNANIELESTDSFATCRGCERMVCRGENCCQWVESIGIWECTGCQSNRVIQQKAGEWLLNQLTTRLQQPGPVELKEGNLLGLGLDTNDARSTSSSSVSVNQRIKVREFIEELLSSMLHGPLDDVSVGQLMKHESYLPLWEGQQQHHSPSDQHFELKRLIQKILEEIAKLPELLNHSGLPLRPEEHLPYFDPKKYEQLLATAVLNKVVDDYRNPKNFTNSGDVAGKSTGVATPFGAVDINHNQLTETAGNHRGLLSEETLRQMSLAADDVHPHEGVSYGATGDRRLSDTDESYLSDYIQRHKVPLPDLSDTTGSGSGAEDDDLQSLKSNATDGTWEENWLFRKRQLKTTESSIAMLVPSPTEEVKALIGDKNADEISDLSEAGSDCEGYESDGQLNAGKDSSRDEGHPEGASSSKETSEGISSSSKTQDLLDEHLPPDSLVSINSLPVNEEILSEAKNSLLLSEQSTPNHTTAGIRLVDDLISMEPVGEKVETTNPALTNPFLVDVFEPNNGVITDDVKLLQRTEAGDSRSVTETHNAGGYGDRKEVPIDRAPPHHTHSNVSPSNPVADSVVIVADSVVDSQPGSGASDSDVTDDIVDRRNTNRPECLRTEELQLLMLETLPLVGSPEQEVQSPHPTMLSFTDVFDQLARTSPLMAISEEQPPAVLLEAANTARFNLEAFENDFVRPEGPPGIIAVTEQMEAYCEQLKGLLVGPDLDTGELEPTENASIMEEAMFSTTSGMPSEQHSDDHETISKSTDTPDALSACQREQTSTPVVSENDTIEVLHSRTTSIPTEQDDIVHEMVSKYPESFDEQEKCEGMQDSEPQPLDSSILPKHSMHEIKEADPSQGDNMSTEQDEDDDETISEMVEISVEQTACQSMHAFKPIPSDSNEEKLDLSLDDYVPTEQNDTNNVTISKSQETSDEQIASHNEQGFKPDLQADEEFEAISESAEALDELAVYQNETQHVDEDLTQVKQIPCTDPTVSMLCETDDTVLIDDITLSDSLLEEGSDESSASGPLASDFIVEKGEIPSTTIMEQPECYSENTAQVVEQEENDHVVIEFTQTEDHPCKDHTNDELLLQTAESVDNLNLIECAEEVVAVFEEPVAFPDTSFELSGSPEALRVSSPNPAHHIVTVQYTPSAEQPASTVTNDADDSSTAATCLGSDETMLASMESQAESKIEDTSMPFSDTELPSLSSPLTSFSSHTLTTTLNNSISTNLTGRASSPSIGTNPPNSHLFVSESLLDVLAPANATADCSIVAAQKEPEQQLSCDAGDHALLQGSGDEQTQDTSLDVPDNLIPGSIAEREHLKWRNAKPIANNPYSPDALQRRLSEKSRPTSMIEIDRLVRKETAPAAVAGVLLDDSDPPREPTDSGTENDRSLQSVMGGALLEKKKIGREYYINDPERLRTTGGSVKQTLGLTQQQQQLSHSTDDEKSLMLGRNLDDGHVLLQITSDPNSALYRSSSFGKQRNPNSEDIFVARPIQVTADDPILKKGTKMNYLSTAAREIFLVPLEPEPNGSLMSSSSELSVHSPTSPSARPEQDSLTYSEDSDVTRIYDLTTGESKVVRAGEAITVQRKSSVADPEMCDTILQILPQLASPVKPVPPPVSASPVPVNIASPTHTASEQSSGADGRGYLRPAPFPVKPLSPDTIKFFAPKRKLSFTGSTSSLAGGDSKSASEQGTTHVLPSMHASLHIDFPASRTPMGSDFSIIEKDVIGMLPSVKELAKCYSGSTSDISTMPPKPLYKPRDFVRQSTDVLNEESSDGLPNGISKGQRQYSSTSNIAVRDEIREIRKLNLEAYKQSTFYPMAPGHSITARSLSKQIREHKNNVTDDHKGGHQDDPLAVSASPGVGGLGDGGGEGIIDGIGNGGDGGGHTSPERPSSPVFQPGHLKSSIEFFESLRKQP